MRGWGDEIQICAGPAGQPEQAATFDWQTFVQRYRHPLLERLHVIKAILNRPDFDLSDAADQLQRQCMSPETLARAARAEDPKDELLGEVAHDESVVARPADGAGTGVEQSEACCGNTAPDPQCVEEVARRFTEFATRQDTLGLLRADNAVKWYLGLMERFGTTYLGAELSHSGVLSDSRHAEVTIPPRPNHRTPVGPTDGNGKQIVRVFTVPLLTSRPNLKLQDESKVLWHLMRRMQVRLAQMELSPSRRRWRGGDQFEIPAMLALARGLERSLADSPPSAVALQVAMDAGEPKLFSKWHDTHPPEHCVRVLAACWQLLLLNHPIYPLAREYLLRKDVRSRIAGRHSVAERTYRIACLDEDPLLRSTLLETCLNGLTPVLTGNDHAAIRAWLEWFRAASANWLRTLTRQCALSSEPARWLRTMDVALSTLETPSFIAVVHDRHVPIVAVGSWMKALNGFPTWHYDSGDWTPGSPLSLPPMNQQHLLTYDAKHQRVVVLPGADDDNSPQRTFQWNGRAWVQCAPLPNVGDLDSVSSFRWQSDGWLWVGSTLAGGRRNGAAKQFAARELLGQLRRRRHPCSQHDLLSLVRWAVPSLAASLEKLLLLFSLEERPMVERAGPFQKALWDALAGQPQSMIGVFERIACPAPLPPGFEALPVSQIEAWVHFLTDLQAIGAS